MSQAMFTAVIVLMVVVLALMIASNHRAAQIRKYEGREAIDIKPLCDGYQKWKRLANDSIPGMERYCP